MSKILKVCNLYCGIGGNRKLWKDVEVTAVELNPKIAEIYQNFFPNDKVIVADAHQYLLEHFGEFDFIWSSPPCPTHSRMNLINVSRGFHKPRYADMAMWQEIIFLKQWVKSNKSKWIVENVVSYYKPLIAPQFSANHYLWANFFIRPVKQRRTKIANFKKRNIPASELQKNHNIIVKHWHGFKGNKDQIINNCVEPELGLHILNESKRDVYPELFK